VKLMTLSEVCKKFGFSRRVIQGYEKEGLIKHSSKNKYGHLMYDDQEVKKIAYIRYLQMNKMTLREISVCVNAGPGSFISASLLNQSNKNLENEISRLKGLIKTNEKILELSSHDKDFENSEEDVLKLIMEEIKNEETI